MKRANLCRAGSLEHLPDLISPGNEDQYKTKMLPSVGDGGIGVWWTHHLGGGVSE